MKQRFIELPDNHGNPLLVEPSRVVAVRFTSSDQCVVMFSGRDDDGVCVGLSVCDTGLRLLELPREESEI
jgi:hypothetical protein